MLFNSFQFLIFFPLVVFVYFIIPKKTRYLWLLATSYYFYMCWNAKYALLLLFSTFITWLSGYFLESFENREWEEKKRKKIRKGWLVFSLFSNLVLLIFFKYFMFLADSINEVLDAFNLRMQLPSLDILLPVGISFFIFQALSYTIDVYRREILAEKNFLKYALFVSFFPQLVAGPIERSGNLLRQIETMEEIQVWNYERIRNGLLLMLFGFFQKLVIADRAALVVNQVFDNYQEYGFIELVTAAILFSWQIYCDFGGYSNIARGAAQVMGVELMENFRQPYLASGIKDFWRRWHISLTSWFTDYLYIPMGGNRKGKVKQCVNILLVFLCSGLWHGANWTYVLWGVLHGCGLIIHNILTWVHPAKESSAFEWLIKLVKTGITYGITTCFWVSFRANTLGDTVGYFIQMFSYRRLHTFEDMGIDHVNWFVLLVAMVILLIVDILHEKGIRIRERLYIKPLVLRGLVYLGAIWCIILLGIYGSRYDASQFIYFQF